MAAATRPPKPVEALTHDEASRKNIPTAEHQPVMSEGDRAPIQVAYKRRNPDLDPQLVWRGKDVQDWSDLVVPAPPLFIQEKVHPKVLIDDLLRQSRESAASDQDEHPDLFADFNGLPEGDAKTEFYQHDANWSNRMILGDSLQVMASLAEREGLRGKVQCIYMDPPYGIKFNSNFQWSTTSRDVRDGKAEHITREPEQVKAFRDTWRDGIHSYLTYLRDRLTVARDLLTESGSIFVQIGDENVHRVRAVMDEVFGEENFVGQVVFRKSGGRSSEGLDGVYDLLLWYARDINLYKFRKLWNRRTDHQLNTAYGYLHFTDGTYRPMTRAEKDDPSMIAEDAKRFRPNRVDSQTGGPSSRFVFRFEDRDIVPPTTGGWRTTEVGFARLSKSSRLMHRGQRPQFRLCDADNPINQLADIWTDTTFVTFGSHKTYVVETNPKVIQRCILMTTDPGDLVLDPTCGSGTTAYVAEQWGRRWITIDTSRVALALARARVMGARYPYYLLADSREGLDKEAKLARTVPDEAKATYGDIRQGFVYERVPHITLKSIANNAQIDEIWKEHQPALEERRARLNEARREAREEWEIPRYPEEPWDEAASALFARLKKEQAKKGADVASVRRLLEELSAVQGRRYTLDSLPKRPADPWPEEHATLHAEWWKARIARQKEMDASIAANANYEYLYDKPYQDKRKARVSGPFTVESLSPHRELGVDDNDDLLDGVAEAKLGYGQEQDFVGVVLDNLRAAGVQHAHKEDKIALSSLVPWPGHLVCAEGRFAEKGGGEANGQGSSSARSSGPLCGLT